MGHLLSGSVQEERTALEAEMLQLKTDVETAGTGLGNGAFAAMKDAQLLEGVAVTINVQVSDPASVLRVAARAAAAAKMLSRHGSVQATLPSRQSACELCPAAY